MPSDAPRIIRSEHLARDAARVILDALNGAVEKRGMVSLMLAGGTTPRSTYELLAQHPEGPWRKTKVFFGDERAVPATHPESNYRMARLALLDHVPVLKENVYRMEGDVADLEGAAAAYTRRLPDAIDVLVLGIGSDGHTASLFPHAQTLDVAGARIVTARSLKAPYGRLTITREVIRHARFCCVLAAGADKARAVAQALQGPDDVPSCPAQLARDRVWIIDAEAARLLSPGSP